MSSGCVDREGVLRVCVERVCREGVLRVDVERVC